MPVSYEKRDHVGIVTFSRPRARNAWGADFNEGLARHLAAMEDDDEVRCAVLTGDEAGGAFSAGANLKDPQTHTMESAADFIKSISRRRDRAFEGLGKESLLRGLDIPNLSDASLVDLYRFAALELTEDKAEGHTAWREKRKPVFRGR